MKKWVTAVREFVDEDGFAFIWPVEVHCRLREFGAIPFLDAHWEVWQGEKLSRELMRGLVRLSDILHAKGLPV
jgi:hypothetical protein